MDLPSNKTSLTLTGIWIATLCGLIIVIWQIGLQTRATLHHIDRWTTTKTELERGVIGGVAFRTTRPSLHRNRLDLGAWHGFQEVFLRDQIDDLRQIDFVFQLSEGAHVSILIECGGDGEAEGYLGLRLSREERLPTAIFDSDPGGRFTRLQLIEIPNIGDSWSQLRIMNTEDRLEFVLNDETIATLPPLSSQKRRVGFRGGKQQSLIDDIVITSQNADPFHESFQYNGDPLRDVARAGVWVILLNIIAIAITWPLRKRKRILQGFALVLINVLALSLITLYGLIDYYYLSSRYSGSVEYYDYSNPIEGEDQVLNRLRAHMEAESTDSTRRRVLFVGSSQTWGAGATRRDENWVSQLESRLNADPALSGPFDLINTGISAATSDSLLVHFEREWLEYDPELVVINLSQNDWEPERFSENLERFTMLTRESGAAMVFVLEPNSIETPHPKLLRNHMAMRRSAAKLDVPVVDMHGYFESEPDQGFLWWDMVHLTSGGQAIFAEKMHRALKPVLEMSERNRSQIP